MKTNMKQWVDELVRRKEVAALPIMTHPGIELNGDTVRQAVSDGRIHHRAVMTLTERYPSCAAATIMDLTTEAEAFGATVAYSDNAVPAVSGRLLTSVDDIAELRVPSLSAGRIPAYLKANLLTARAVTDRPVLGGCIGPFSLAGRLFGMSEIMVLLYEEPDAAHQLLAKCTAFIGNYCAALKLTGVNGVVMAEPAAGLLSDDDCMRFSSAYVGRIVERVQDEQFFVVLHNCGNTGYCTHAMVQTGAAAFHFGNKCRMEEVLRDVPPTALAMGNLDPVSVMKDGTPEQVRGAVVDLLERTRDFPNFVLSTGCDVPPQTPLANIDAFFGALSEWNVDH